MYGSLAAILRMRALCRAVAIVCTAAFLFVGFAHSLQHCDATATGYEATFAASGDAPDSSDDASRAAGHCHGCVMVATTSAASAAALTLVPLRPLAVLPADARPHPPLAETPPPKSTT